jgi:hydrogenase maturation factor HypF (carbamoyltransferase family)
MSKYTVCPSCNQKYTGLKDEHAGKPTTCKKCGTKFVVIDFCINNAIMDIHGGYSLCDHPVPLT